MDVLEQVSYGHVLVARYPTDVIVNGNRVPEGLLDELVRAGLIDCGSVVTDGAGPELSSVQAVRLTKMGRDVLAWRKA